MKNFKPALLIVLLSCSGNVLLAGKPDAKAVHARVYPDCRLINHQQWNFVGNKGQLTDRSGNVLHDIQYYGSQGGADVFCRPGKISFVFVRIEKGPGSISEATGSHVETQCLRLHRASATPHPPLSQDAFNASLQGGITTSRTDLVLLNSNPNARIIASGRQEYYENFYNSNTGSEGITNVHTYTTITYQNIYPHIDFILRSRKEGMEYEFMVRPGGKTSDIQMQWEGLERIEKLKDSGIEYFLPFGKIRESNPVSFQSGHEIPSRFARKGSFIGFHIGRYDHSKGLLIDPVLDWSTYYGQSADDNPNMSVDKQGNIYIAGQTNSTSGIASPGAFLTKNNDSLYVNYLGEAYLAKFSPSGSRLWGTYYGGFGNVFSNGVAVDSAGNAVILGGVTSINSGIATSGAYQTSQPANLYVEVFVAKFSPAGDRLWGTYFGQDDVGDGVAIDASNNIILAGTTVDSGMGTPGVFRSWYSYAQDSVDMFVAKLSPSGTKTWFTYFGGRGQEGCSGIAVDPLGNILVIGTTTSDSGIATTGAFQTELGYTFVAKFTAMGGLDWGTYFGKGQGDNIYGVAADPDGNVAITGGFSSSVADAGMATSGVYQTSWATMYVAKFSPSGSRTWCTYYGNSASGYMGGIAADNNGDFFFTGQIGRPSLGFWLDSGIATSGAYQTEDNFVGQTSFLTELSPMGGVLYATYFGGYWGGTQGKAVCAFFPGLVYLMGTTMDSSGIATSGAYQTVWTGYHVTGFGDAFLAKFDFDKSGIEESHSGPISIALYPNPAQGQIILTASGLSPGAVTYSVYDITGNKVNTNILYPLSGNLNKEIDVSGYAKGVYYIELVQGDKRSVQKLVVE